MTKVSRPEGSDKLTDVAEIETVRQSVVQIWKMFLAGAFIGSGILGALLPRFGMTAPTFSVPTLLPAVTVGDLLEMGGTILTGVLVSIFAAGSRSRSAD